MSNPISVEKGIVFDIQRAGLYDGPGVRTVIFLKGCPLRCQWCHNPESQQKKPQISFRPGTCVLCGACAEACEHNAHQVDENGHVYRREDCVRCGQCVEACAFEALQVTGREMSVDEILAEAARDRVYYDRSGGGVTLTGGEPMAQFAFTRALLEGAKGMGIHTCIETCGFAPARQYEEILPLVDLFLLDYKATGEGAHRRLTGVSPALILENLRMLASRGARIWLRCPMVPGVNDTTEHLQAIVDLERQYPQIERVEIMAYHNIGNDKYSRYGMENPLPGVETTSEVTKTAWLETLRQMGSEKARLG